MRMLIALAVLASCCAAQVQAQATEEAQPTQAVTQQANPVQDQAATPPATAAEKDQPAKEHANAAAATKTAAVEEKPKTFKAPAGFRSRTVGGETRYCQQQVVLGSRFGKEVCYTQAQVKDLEANIAAQRQDMARTGVCGGPCTDAK
jgi:hypothetical protein